MGGLGHPSGGQYRSGARTTFTMVAPGVNAAISRGLFRQVRFLVQFGADVNERDVEGRTPLVHCALVDSEPWAVGLARILIEKGASIGRRDRNGLNALHYAAIYGRPDLVQVFLNAVDFDLNQGDRLGNTALHYSMSVGNALVVERLATALKHYQLPLDLTNKKGMTPLMQAYKCGNVECAALLLSPEENTCYASGPSGAGEMGYEAEESRSDGPHPTIVANQMSECKTANEGGNKRLTLIHETARAASAETPRVHVIMKSPTLRSTPQSQQRRTLCPTSAHMTSVGAHSGSRQPRQQSARRSAWRPCREEEYVEPDLETDILNQPKDVERLYYEASETELRNRPEVVFNMDPIACLQQGTSTHPQISRRCPVSAQSPCITVKPPLGRPPSSWRCQMKKLYGAFEFQFTTSFVAAVRPLTPAPNQEQDSDDLSSLRPGSALPSEDTSGSMSDIASSCSKRSLTRRPSVGNGAADVKSRRQLIISSSKKRQLAALLTLRGDSDTSSTDTSVSSASSRRPKDLTDLSECSSSTSKKSGKARLGMLIGPLQATSKIKEGTNTN